MFSDLIAGFLAFLAHFVDTYVPVIELPSSGFAGMASSIVVVVDLLAKVNYVVPVDTFLAPIMVVMGVKGAMVAFWIGNWVYNKITQLIP